MSAARPSVSAVIVTWNSKRWLEGCFESLRAQTHGDIEIVVVDNGSTDGSLDWVRINEPTAVLIANDSNRGFCVANNQGIAASTGKYVLCVNTDVVLAPDFVEILVDELEGDTGLGSASGKLLRGPAPTDGSPRVIDSAGEVFYQTLRMVNRGEEEIDRGQYDEREEVFGSTAATALYRRAMLEEIRDGDEYFDTDFFSYLEDSDLNWRAQIRGWRCVYQPAAVGDHIRSHAGSHNLMIQRHAHANRYLAILKNASLRNVIRMAPHLLIYEAHRTLKTLFLRPRLLPAYFKVLRFALRCLRKRRAIQRGRRADAARFRAMMLPESYGRELRERLGFGRRRDREERETLSSPAPPAARESGVRQEAP